MNYTPQIKKAIQFAAKKHYGQFRKETEPLPYITHLFSVALLVAEDGANDNSVIAALLHDTLEDTDTTPDEIGKEFGRTVRKLVEAVSEPKRGASGETLAWHERKEAYFRQLKTAPEDALVIMAADKIDNIESKITAFEAEGPHIFKRWSQPTSEYLWYHKTALELALKRIPTHPLTARLAEAHKRECAIFGAP